MNPSLVRTSLALSVAILILGGCATAKTPTEPAAAASPAPPPAPAAPVDSDGDGVFDDQDACPGTPAGVKVDAKGCEILLNLAGPNFAFDSSKLTDEGKAKVDTVVELLRSNPTKRVEIAGHADSTGPEDYNQGLSERRAKTVADYLTSQGIDAGRLEVVGYGESRPAESNDTRAGRAANRRAEIVDLGSR